MQTLEQCLKDLVTRKQVDAADARRKANKTLDL